MVKGSVTKPTEIMSEKDSIDAFVDGAKKASCAARELASECNNPEWAHVATTLEAMSDGGKKLMDMKAMTRFETLMATNLKANPKGFIH